MKTLSEICVIIKKNYNSRVNGLYWTGGLCFSSLQVFHRALISGAEYDLFKDELKKTAKDLGIKEYSGEYFWGVEDTVNRISWLDERIVKV